MLEYNGDTPSMTIESSVVQAEWFSDIYGDAKENLTQTNMMSNLIDQAFTAIGNSCLLKPEDLIGLVNINEDLEMTA